MAKWEEEIIDPYLGIKNQRVNTEFYLGRLEYEAAIAGRYKHLAPLNYKYAVEQFEILGIGSGLLNAKYFKEKQLLKENAEKNKAALGINIQLSIKKSSLNPRMQKQIQELEMEYITEWHTLLMRYLSPLFYIKRRVERI